MLHVLKTTRRAVVGAVAAFGLLATAAVAQEFPSKAVTLVVPYPPGGHLDITGRLFAERLSEELGQTVIVENRPGASGTVGAGSVARETADGYTLLLAVNSLAIADTLISDISYRLGTDLEPVAMLSRYPYVLSATADLPPDTFADLIEYGRENPGLSLATMGVGSANHLTMEVINSRTGANFLHIPYTSSGNALTDTIGGRVKLMIVPYTNIIQQLASGDLKALAVSTNERASFLPDTQSFGDIPELEEFDVLGWAVVFAPAGVPDEVIEAYTNAIESLAGDEEFVADMQNINVDLDVMTGEPLVEFIDGEVEFWGEVIRDAGVEQR